MATVLVRYQDGQEETKAKTFGVKDAGSVISEEGQTYFEDDPDVAEIVIRPD